jgi:hypothetical protein
MDSWKKTRVGLVAILMAANIAVAAIWTHEALAANGGQEWGLCNEPEENCKCTTFRPDKHGFCSVTGNFEPCVREGTSDPCYSPE